MRERYEQKVVTTSSMKKKKVKTEEDPTVLGLRNLVTEYAHGRMVTPPGRESVKPECQISMTDGGDYRRILAIVSVTADTWVAHGYREALNEGNFEFEYHRAPYLPDAFEFKVSDADAALQILLSQMLHIPPGRSPSDMQIDEIHFAVPLTVGKTHFDLLRAAPTLSDLAKAPNRHNSDDHDDPHAVYSSARPRDRRIIGLNSTAIAATFARIHTALDEDNLRTHVLVPLKSKATEENGLAALPPSREYDSTMGDDDLIYM